MDNREYYKNLLIIQYHDQPKAQATIGTMYDNLMPVNNKTGNLLSIDIQNAFDIDTAVGVQLDIIGYYIGIDRLYKGQNLDNITAYGYTDQYATDYSDVVGMSTDVSFPTDAGTFLSADEVISITNKLSDDDFRFLLKLKAAKNNCDHSSYSIDKILYDFFSTDLSYIDNYDMTLDYFVSEKYLRLIPIMYQKDLFLKPMGVWVKNVILAKFYYGFLDASDLIDVDVDDNSGFSSVDSFATDNGTFFGIEDIVI